MNFRLRIFHVHFTLQFLRHVLSFFVDQTIFKKRDDLIRAY